MSIARVTVLVALVAFAWVQQAHAVVTPFPNRAAFDAAFPGAIIEGWDSFPAGTTFANGSTVNGITYNSSAGNAVVTNVFLTTSGANGLGRTPGQFFEATDTMTFSFATPLLAWAIDINTFATANGSYTATTNMGEVVTSVFNPFPGFTTGQFIGFSTTLAFTSITIAATTGFAYTLDTMRMQPVPEPGTVLLLGSGLVVGLIPYVWRRRAHSRRRTEKS